MEGENGKSKPNQMKVRLRLYDADSNRCRTQAAAPKAAE